MKIILLIGIALYVTIKSKIRPYRNKFQEVTYQQEKQEFMKKRSAYFAEERQKVMEHYRQKIVSKELTVYDALKDTARLMAFNSGGENSWKQEFATFKKEIKVIFVS